MFLIKRVWYCYLLMLFWIFTVIIGVYVYLSSATTEKSVNSLSLNEIFNSPSYSNKYDKENKYYKKINKLCHPSRTISLGSENAVTGNFTLKGIAVLFRHGDRGPINHVRQMEMLTCDQYEDANMTSTLERYKGFLTTYWTSLSSGQLYRVNGQMPNYGPIPNGSRCEIGLLTTIGVVQHLKLGSILRDAYYDSLFHSESAFGVLAYTTKYRRTFQSLNAFLYGLLTEQGFRKIPLYPHLNSAASVRELMMRLILPIETDKRFWVNTVYYCFEECACTAANQYSKRWQAETAKRWKSHPATARLVADAGEVVYASAPTSGDAYTLVDALLAFACHGARLPCAHSKCVYAEHVNRLFAYVDWDLKMTAKNRHRQRYSALVAYGLVKNVVSRLLAIASDERPNVVTYSAHDKTLQHLLTAFGITTNEATMPPYASRVIFEVYNKNDSVHSTNRKFYFRLVFNGKDYTNRIKFCANETNLLILPSSGGGKLSVFLCTLESLVRFLHDDYFAPFGSSNFKDACSAG